MNLTYYLLILLCTLFVLNRVYISLRFNRHKVYQRKAHRVLKKIRSFSGDKKNAQIFSYLRKINPFVFEELLLHCFESKGFQVIRNKRYTGDGGIDGQVIDQENNLILIQAKRYSSSIDPQHVEDFSQLVKHHKKAKKGYFIHTGKTGAQARILFNINNHVDLISGESLIQLILPVGQSGAKPTVKTLNYV